MVLCLFSVYCCGYAHECLLPVIHLLLYVVYVISCLNVKSERKMQMSFNCFSV
jgi:hypothetical protein